MGGLVLEGVLGRRGRGWRGLKDYHGLRATFPARLFLNKMDVYFFLKRNNSKLEENSGYAVVMCTISEVSTRICLRKYGVMNKTYTADNLDRLPAMAEKYSSLEN